MSAFYFSEVHRWDFEESYLWLYLIAQLVIKYWYSEFKTHKNRPWTIFAGIFNFPRLVVFLSTHHIHTDRTKLYCVTENRDDWKVSVCNQRYPDINQDIIKSAPHEIVEQALKTILLYNNIFYVWDKLNTL